MKRAFALITLVAISATPAFSVVFDTASGTNWFDDSNYAPVGVPSATTNVDIFSTAAVAAEIQSAVALANQVKLGRSNWPGSLVVGASGTLTTTSNLTLQLAANGNQTSSLTNHGVITLGASLRSLGINTIENHGTLIAASMVLGGHANAESSFTNTGTIDLGSSGWLHLCSKSTVGTEFTMLDGSVTAKRLNLHSGRKINLKLYGGTIRVNDMTSASADFLIDVKGDGELILKGDAVSKLDGWIAAGYVFTSAASGEVIARYDAASNTTRLYADVTAPMPNPAGFDGAPMALDASSVRMLAMPGSDKSRVVEYLFTETSGNAGGSSSGWQSSPYYEDTELTAGWSANAGVSGLAVMDGRLTGVVSGNEPQLSKTDFAFEGNSALQIRLRYRNSSSGVVRLWWGTSINDAFGVDRQLAVTYSGAGDWQVLVFDLGRESEWLDHEITRLRIDPNGSSGVFEVDYIRGCGPKKTDHAVWAAGWYGNELGDPWAVRGRNGLTNQHARLWGMDPYASNRVSPITQPLNMSNGVFSYTRRDVGLSGAAYSVWVPTDLVNWTEDTNAT